jgi:hypothetical protein
VLTNTYFERSVEQIVDIVRRFAGALAEAGIPYRVVGGLGVFLHIERVDPLLARMTRDVDVAVARADLQRIRDAVAARGFAYRHAAGVDMFVDASNPRARSAVHLVFVGERVRADYPEPVPAFSDAVRTSEGIAVAPVAELLRMKLTSFRLKDRVHVQDLDRAGLITPDVEAGLSDVLRARLHEVRATE